MALRFDQIGVWSEIKLEIIKKYASAYSTVLAAQESPRLHHVYIDAFAGAGVHVSKTTREIIPGSPLNALAVQPPFREYFLIDLDGEKVNFLRQQIGRRSDVHILHGDCNRVLEEEVFPQVKFEQFRRGLCILDPYGLQLNWEILQSAGEMRTLDIFLNFPVMDMNRNVLWHDSGGVAEEDIARMNRFWGDESWKTAAFSSNLDLFGNSFLDKRPNSAIVEAFRQRLKNVANFAHVPEPIPMRNSKGATIYYLFFASQKDVALGIVRSIFEKYSCRGLQG